MKALVNTYGGSTRNGSVHLNRTGINHKGNRNKTRQQSYLSPVHKKHNTKAINKITNDISSNRH